MNTSPAPHVLFGTASIAQALPVCDHYAGVPARMEKSLQLQQTMGRIHGRCLFDITLDAEDGAEIGAEREHAALMARLIASESNVYQRVGARVHDVHHPSFREDVSTLVRMAGERIAYLMIPKVSDLQDLDAAAAWVHHCSQEVGLSKPIPLHILIETLPGVESVKSLAAHPMVQSLSFGLMDFVSDYQGAIPRSAMTAQGQFEHPLVVRAKLDIASAAHTHGKVPSHCVVMEFKSSHALKQAAQRARNELGYTRMWSIHPDQIQPIVEAFSSDDDEIQEAQKILRQALSAKWGPIRYEHNGNITLHDRASYRYYWHRLRQAITLGQWQPDDDLLHLFSDLPR